MAELGDRSTTKNTLTFALDGVEAAACCPPVGRLGRIAAIITSVTASVSPHQRHTVAHRAPAAVCNWYIVISRITMSTSAITRSMAGGSTGSKVIGAAPPEI